MIEVKKIIDLVRFKQKDHSKVLFSDYEILQSINECIRYMNQVFALKNSDFLEKIHKYDEDEINAVLPAGSGRIDFFIDGVPLPEDFVSLVNIVRTNDNYNLSPAPALELITYSTYRITAGRLYSKAKCVRMLYRAKIAAAEDIDSKVELPEVFTDVMVKVAGLILRNTETDILLQEVVKNMEGIVPARRYGNVKVRMPFKV